MADDQPDKGPTDDAPHGDNPPDKGTGDTDLKARLDQLLRESRKWEDRAKANDAKVKELEPLARKAKELEDAGKSDLERLTSEVQSHSTRAAQAEGELMRLKVAVRKGLTETQAKRLVGSSEEELEADADDLLASFRPAEKEPDPGPEPDPRPDNSRRRPQERLRPGAVPDADTEPEETDPRKLAAMVPRRFLN
jgi:hypothetical protein